MVIEEVSFDEITPPVEVKADFLDVANARAEREQFIQMALSSADQRHRSAEAEVREIRDAALSEARETRQAAQGSAARFLQIIREFQEPDSPETKNRSAARRLALERYYYQTVAEILERVQGKVFLDTGQPVDLTIWGLPGSGKPARGNRPECKPILPRDMMKKVAVLSANVACLPRIVSWRAEPLRSRSEGRVCPKD